MRKCKDWLGGGVHMVPYYETGLGRLYHGDCLEVIPGLERVDLVLTDPPYGININKSNRLSTSRGFGGETWDKHPVSSEVLKLIIEHSTNQIIWGGNYFDLPPTKCFFIWDKKNDGRDFADCEFAWSSFNSVARMFRKRPQKLDGGKVHPTQKPIYLFSWLIDTYSEKQHLVCDPFIGSGTTAISCEKLNRKWIGIEISEKYCEVAAKRIEQERSQLKLW